jgi:ArsR family transcriptional regulator
VAKAKKNGLKNLEFRLGDLQNPPIEAGSVDLVILSQAASRGRPAAALAGAAKLLKPRGQILILDLLKHNFTDARKLYGDRWLGLPRAICIAGWRPRASRPSRSASSRARNSHRTFRPSWPEG